MQLGGSDQWGNIVAGLDLIKRMLPHKIAEPAGGVTVPLLTDATGAKLGKSSENGLWLCRDLTTPYEFY